MDKLQKTISPFEAVNTATTRSVRRVVLIGFLMNAPRSLASSNCGRGIQVLDLNCIGWIRTERCSLSTPTRQRGGIWEHDTWADVFPKKASSMAVKMGETGPKLLMLKSEYPNPLQSSKPRAYKAAYKELKTEAYIAYRDRQIKRIMQTTKDPRKIAKKLDRVWDPKKHHPVNKKVRDFLKQRVYDQVPKNPKYQEQLALHNQRAAIDQGISEGHVELVDSLKPQLFDEVWSTGLSYGMTSGAIASLTRLAVGVISPKKGETWSDTFEAARDEGTRAVIETGLVAPPFKGFC